MSRTVLLFYDNIISRGREVIPWIFGLKCQFLIFFRKKNESVMNNIFFGWIWSSSKIEMMRCLQLFQEQISEQVYPRKFDFWQVDCQEKSCFFTSFFPITRVILVGSMIRKVLLFFDDSINKGQKSFLELFT